MHIFHFDQKRLADSPCEYFKDLKETNFIISTPTNDGKKIIFSQEKSLENLSRGLQRDYKGTWPREGSHFIIGSEAIPQGEYGQNFETIEEYVKFMMSKGFSPNETFRISQFYCQDHPNIFSVVFATLKKVEWLLSADQSKYCCSIRKDHNGDIILESCVSELILRKPTAQGFQELCLPGTFSYQFKLTKNGFALQYVDVSNTVLKDFLESGHINVSDKFIEFANIQEKIKKKIDDINDNELKKILNLFNVDENIHSSSSYKKLLNFYFLYLKTIEKNNNIYIKNYLKVIINKGMDFFIKANNKDCLNEKNIDFILDFLGVFVKNKDASSDNILILNQCFESSASNFFHYNKNFDLLFPEIKNDNEGNSIRKNAIKIQKKHDDLLSNFKLSEVSMIRINRDMQKNLELQMINIIKKINFNEKIKFYYQQKAISETYDIILRDPAHPERIEDRTLGIDLLYSVYIELSKFPGFNPRLLAEKLVKMNVPVIAVDLLLLSEHSANLSNDLLSRNLMSFKNFLYQFISLKMNHDGKQDIMRHEKRQQYQADISKNFKKEIQKMKLNNRLLLLPQENNQQGFSQFSNLTSLQSQKDLPVSISKYSENNKTTTIDLPIEYQNNQSLKIVDKGLRKAKDNMQSSGLLKSGEEGKHKNEILEKQLKELESLKKLFDCGKYREFLLQLKRSVDLFKKFPYELEDKSKMPWFNRFKLWINKDILRNYPSSYYFINDLYEKTRNLHSVIYVQEFEKERQESVRERSISEMISSKTDKLFTAVSITKSKTEIPQATTEIIEEKLNNRAMKKYIDVVSFQGNTGKSTASSSAM